MASERVQYISKTVAPPMRVEGLQETVAMLDELPRAIVLAGLTGALQSAGNVFLGELQARTPVRSEELWNDEIFATFRNETGGYLRAALRSEITLDANYRGGVIEIHFGNQGHVANWVEYGHRMVTHWANKEKYTDSRGRERTKKWGGHREVGFVAAHPFMRPAFDAGNERAVDAFVESIAQTVRNYKAQWGMAA